MGENRPQSVFRLFLIRFVPMVFLVALAAVLILRARDGAHLDEVMDDQEGLVTLEVQKIRSTFSSAIADAVYLSELTLQRLYLEPTPEEFQAAVSSEYQAFLRSRVVFNSVAYLDEEGGERVRVERRGAISRRVAEFELQSHGSHDHHARALGERGLTWLSPADSAVSASRPDSLRHTSLFLERSLSESGDGSVLLNFSLGPFLEGLLDGYMGRRSRLFLATDSGEWLLGPAEVGGGEHGEVFRVADDFPEEWAEVARGGSGRVLTSARLFTYSPVNPATAADLRNWRLGRGFGCVAFVGVVHLAFCMGRTPWRVGSAGTGFLGRKPCGSCFTRTGPLVLDPSVLQAFQAVIQLLVVLEDLVPGNHATFVGGRAAENRQEVAAYTLGNG